MVKIHAFKKVSITTIKVLFKKKEKKRKGLSKLARRWSK